MIKKYTYLLAIASLLVFTACDSDKTIDDLRGTNDSEKEKLAKKDFLYIIKYTPESVCKSKSFKTAIEKAIEAYIDEKGSPVGNIKDIITSVQSNDVICETFEPEDITDLVDPICKIEKAADISEDYELPEGLELNEEINTSCVVGGDTL